MYDLISMEKSHISYSIRGNFDNKTKISLENIKCEVNDNLKSIKYSEKKIKKNIIKIVKIEKNKLRFFEIAPNKP